MAFIETVFESLRQVHHASTTQIEWNECDFVSCRTKPINRAIRTDVEAY